MRFGVREICNVIFKARGYMRIGNKEFFKDEPVIKFESLKTSTVEGASTTVYATGGRGNARLVAWDGERTLTFTMEDALISTESIAVLTGAGVVEAAASEGEWGKPILEHVTEYIEVKSDATTIAPTKTAKGTVYYIIVDDNGEFVSEPYTAYHTDMKGKKVFADYYIEKTSGAYVMSISPEVFSGNFYIEGETLFREQGSGSDMPAEFIIPNGKVQSNFTFSMASSGDPSTFTFTVDAFPAYTKNTKDKKVFCDIQVIYEDVDDGNKTRATTWDGKAPKTATSATETEESGSEDPDETTN